MLEGVRRATTHRLRGKEDGACGPALEAAAPMGLGWGEEAVGAGRQTVGAGDLKVDWAAWGSGRGSASAAGGVRRSGVEDDRGDVRVGRRRP